MSKGIIALCEDFLSRVLLLPRPTTQEWGEERGEGHPRSRLHCMEERERLVAAPPHFAAGERPQHSPSSSSLCRVVAPPAQDYSLIPQRGIPSGRLMIACRQGVSAVALFSKSVSGEAGRGGARK